MSDFPTMQQLMAAPVDIAGPARKIRNPHLDAAGVLGTVEMRLKVERQRLAPGEPEDYEMLLELRNSKTFGANGFSVVCPGCEEADEDETCAWCGGTGIVDPETWDRWFDEERGCLNHSPGCEKICKRPSCSYDRLRNPVDIPVLILQARKLNGSWKAAGDSLSGFRLKGLVTNPAALMRYLDLVALAVGMPPVVED